MVDIIVGAISIGIVFLYGSVGETVMEKAGHLNLGIPGIMCMGTAGGCVGVWLCMELGLAAWVPLIFIPMIFSMIFAALGGLIYAVLTVSLKSNQNVVGLAITTFGAGFSQLVISSLDRTRFARASKIIKKLFTFSDKLGVFGKLFLSYGFFVYFAIAIAFVVAYFFRKTKVGLNLRAIGENPSAADAVGIDVDKYKYVAILVGSAIAGLGGLYYVMEYNSGTFDNVSTIQGFGWLAVALVIFTMWKSDLCIVGSIVFGALYVLGPKLTGLSSLGQQELIKLLPYVVTIVVLVLTSIFDKKENQPPAALGLSYFREER